MLFLGNSYTFVNDLDLVVAEVFEAAEEARPDTQRLASAGWTLHDHLVAVQTEGSDHALAFAAPHDWVFLQDQSQIPGFPEGDPALEASRAAAVALDGYAAATGAQTMFLMTWGRRDGDSANPSVYPDFSTMQARLADGYLAYVALAGKDGSPAWLAPIGLAWARVWQDQVDLGVDPLAASSPFVGLYSSDGSHPSPAGTYLAACVIYASLTGRSPLGIDPPEGLAEAAYLQEVAARVVLEGEGIAYPWSTSADGGAAGDGGDSTADGGGGDGGGGDGGEDPADGPSAEAGTGCGCGAGEPQGLALLGLVLALLAQRAKASSSRSMSSSRS